MSPYHEAERIELRASMPLARKTLHAYLRGLGFKAIDDFYVFPRSESPKPWQSEDIVVLDVKLEGKAIYETEEDLAEGKGTQWDSLLLKYPMATVPVECLPVFILKATELASHFGLLPWYQEREMTMAEIAGEFSKIANYLSDSWFDPGSENLALLIAQEYPRR